MRTKTNIMLMGLFLIVYEALAKDKFYEEEERLHAQILSKYNRKIRPNSQVICTIRLGIQHINHLDATLHTFSMTGWLTIHWYDHRLTWNPRNYSNISHIYPLKSNIWTPEIILENSVTNPISFMHDDISVKVSSYGHVTWEPSGVAETQCKVDLTYYPFDEQVCMVEVNTWDYGKEEIRLIPYQDGVYLESLLPSVEWVLNDHWSVAKEIYDGVTTLDQVDFYLKMKRKYDHFIMTVLLPVIFVSLICPLGFFLPFEGGKKAQYSLTILLTYTFMPSLINMPSTSGKNCILGIYMTTILMICVITTLLNIFCMFLYFGPQTPVPHRVQILFRRSFIPLLGWDKKRSQMQTPMENIFKNKRSTESNNSCRRQMPTQSPDRFGPKEPKSADETQRYDKNIEKQAWRLDRVVIPQGKPRQEKENNDNENEQRNNSHKHRDMIFENRDISNEVLRNNRDIRLDDIDIRLNGIDIRHDNRVIRHEQRNNGLEDSKGRFEYKNPNMEEEVKWITNPRILYPSDHTRRHESFNGNNNGKHQDSLSSLSSQKTPFKIWSLGNLVNKKFFRNSSPEEQTFEQYAKSTISTSIDKELSSKDSKNTHDLVTKGDNFFEVFDELSWRNIACILDSFFQRLFPIIVITFTITMVAILVNAGHTNTGRNGTKI